MGRAIGPLLVGLTTWRRSGETVGCLRHRTGSWERPMSGNERVSAETMMMMKDNIIELINYRK